MSKKTKFQKFADKHKINLDEYRKADKVLNDCISSYERTEKKHQDLSPQMKGLLKKVITAADEKITEYLQRLHDLNMQPDQDQNNAEVMAMKTKALSLKMKMKKKKNMNNLSGLSSN